MTIAIIGAGLTGLTAAYELLKLGHSVTVFEKEETIGGLVGGFQMPQWEWSLEFFYHHFFTNDDVLINLAKELGLEKDMLILRPITATLVKNNSLKNKTGDPSTPLRTIARGEWKKFRSSLPELNRENDIAKNTIASSGTRNFLYEHQRETEIYQLDSPLHLLTFPLLSLLDKLRTAALLGFCKINPFWQPLEKITAERFFKAIGGSNTWNILWNPLMEGKFGDFADQVPASWLWARFHKRTMKLGYFQGGFRTFVDALVDAIKKQKGTILSNTSVTNIQQCNNRTTKQWKIVSNNKTYIFDVVLLTTPSSIATKLIHFPKPYEQKLKSIPHLWAQTLILETKEPIVENTYWLNIMDPLFPFIAVVAHTNMVDKKFYGGRHITYIGNYLPDGHPYLTMTKQQLLNKFLPSIKKINKYVSNRTIEHYYLYTAPSAQPVHTINYSQKAPTIQTPIERIYLANLDSIYPWDRGTNYAVELGQHAATTINILS